MENKQETSRKLLVAVAFDEVNNTYIVDVPKGMSANEVAFGVHVIAKCFERDNVMSAKEFIQQVEHYIGDAQFAEVKQ